MFALVLAAIPGFIAWQYSPHEPNTPKDPNFWFHVESCMIQLIGLATIVLPLVWKERIHLKRWMWTWLLVVVGVVYGVGQIPMYLYLPTEWSATMAFVESAAKSFVTLQALFIALEDDRYT
ncbi:hypothetical protein GQ43DRAFT_474196 [Delitschia confertaspora ATCC 74209]|uniref:Uncharacterized protein n=1 Tax=Delitschia confertaspora ATCC 74209 TaxID=1513339 RepID=A0A9P4JG80_9PLEO|nr:hypothetical protein GQ43DRAFT_474196 [Delitschia confertaspora ATCC 74209]